MLIRAGLGVKSQGQGSKCVTHSFIRIGFRAEESPGLGLGRT